MKSGSIIIDVKSERAIASGCRDLNGASLRTLRYPMLDRIFDDQLKNQAGYLSVKKLSWDVYPQLKTIPKAYLLNVEILLQKLHFFPKWNLLAP